MYTVKEAIKKWCPFFVDGNIIENNCIADECIEWRWSGATVQYAKDNPDTKGYCGMAGKP